MAMGPGVDQRRQHAGVVAAAVGVVLFLALPFAVATAVYPTLADGPDLLAHALRQPSTFVWPGWPAATAWLPC